jgi:hypothetical protein
MNLAALQHLIRVVRVLTEDGEVLVVGSASLLASYPELGEDSQPLASTFDADLCPQPFEETVALMIQESLGESGAFHLCYGYHADVLREAVFETFSPGWRERLVPIPGTEGGFALEPHDLAATKLLVGREKDIALVRHLAITSRLSRLIVEERLAAIPKSERYIVTSNRALREAFDGGTPE